MSYDQMQERLRKQLARYLAEHGFDPDYPEVRSKMSLTEFARRMEIATQRKRPNPEADLQRFLDGESGDSALLASLSFMLSEDEEQSSDEYNGPLFDMAERARILRALLAYSAEHRIGSPTLAKRINGGKEPSWFRSFRRFFEMTENPKSGNPYRLKDDTMALCAKFVEGLQTQSPDRKLATALSIFYGANDLDWLPGDYLSMSGLDFNEKRSGKTTIRGEAGAWKIVERRGPNVYNGAIVKAENGFIATLINRAYGTPRSFVAQQVPEGNTLERLVGIGCGIEFLHGKTVRGIMSGGEPTPFTILISEKAKQ